MRFLTRRRLLSGGVAVSLASLGEIFRQRASAVAEDPAKVDPGTSGPDTAVIFVTMGGGASQFETFDPKPDAPAEYRGAFSPIDTRIAGVQFCELLPRLATIADRLAIIRSVHHEQASHIAEHIVETGYDLMNPTKSRTGDMPSIGAVVSRVRGVSPGGIPAYVSLPRHHGYSSPQWLGMQHHFFAVDQDPNLPGFAIDNLSLTGGTLERVQRRCELQSHLSGRNSWEVKAGATTDIFLRQAIDLITSPIAQRAFDIAREDVRIRERYGRNILGQRMLLARRLVEAGVPFIKVRMGDWDDHENLAPLIMARALLFDTAVAALIEDLATRGLERRVLVVAMGEFGRTPRINLKAGRDHYPAVNSVLLSGGAYRMGQVIGATDRYAACVASAPYRPQNVLGMVYRHLGIEPATTFEDYTGRPRAILEERQPIQELIS